MKNKKHQTGKLDYNLNILVSDQLPHWYSRKPEELISFKQIYDKYSKAIQDQMLYAFMFGDISAFNSIRNTPALPIALSGPKNGLYTFLMGSFPRNIDGSLEFLAPPKEISDYGNFSYKSGLGAILPYWTFRPHSYSVTKFNHNSTTKNITLRVPFRRTGSRTIPKSILLHLSNHSDHGFTISAECEDYYYRGINEEMITKAQSFIAQNGLRVEKEVQHILREEVIFLCANLMGEHQPTEPTPSQYLHKQLLAKQTLGIFINNLVFLRKEVDAFIEDLPTSKNDARKDIGRICQNNENEPKPLKEESYTFLQQDSKIWKIQYCSETIRIPDRKGLLYIHRLISEGTYTSYQNLYDMCSMVEICETNLSEFENTKDTHKTIAKYETEMKRLKKDLKELETLISEDEDDDPIVVEMAKKQLATKLEEYQFYEKEKQVKYYGEDVRSKSAKKKADSVRRAIYEALEVIEDESPDIADHIRASYKKKHFLLGKGKASRVEISYIPDRNITWSLK